MDGLIATMPLDPVDGPISVLVKERECSLSLEPFGDLDGLDANARGDRDGHHLPIEVGHADGVSCQQSTERTRLLLGCSGADRWPADPELFAAAAGDDIAWPVIKEARDAPSHFGKHGVSGWVAVGIVDQLEMVEVDQHERDEWQLAPFTVHIIREVWDATGQRSQFSPEVFVKGSPIGKTGESVRPGCLLKIGDLRLESLDLGVLGHDFSREDGQLVEPVLGQSLGPALEEANESSGQDVSPGIVTLPAFHEDADGVLPLSTEGLAGQELFLEMFNLRHGVLLGGWLTRGRLEDAKKYVKGR